MQITLDLLKAYKAYIELWCIYRARFEIIFPIKVSSLRIIKAYIDKNTYKNLDFSG